jgi:orotate phosphoribosyltransferase-like protein
MNRKRRTTRETDYIQKEAKKLHKKGLSYAEISKVLDMSKQLAQYYVSTRRRKIKDK